MSTHIFHILVLRCLSKKSNTRQMDITFDILHLVSLLHVVGGGHSFHHMLTQQENQFLYFFALMMEYHLSSLIWLSCLALQEFLLKKSSIFKCTKVGQWHLSKVEGTLSIRKFLLSLFYFPTLIYPYLFKRMHSNFVPSVKLF